MGEFLLSILGFSEDESHLVYVKKTFRSKFKAGDAVNLSTPNPNREHQTTYYRIYGNFYPIEVLHELVRSQNPNVVDRDGFVPYQRELRDADIAVSISEGETITELAKGYGWHEEAIKLALVRHKTKMLAKREAEDTLDDEPRITPEQLTAEQIAKREALLAQWD
jgi:hypothetical protein